MTLVEFGFIFHQSDFVGKLLKIVESVLNVWSDFEPFSTRPVSFKSPKDEKHNVSLELNDVVLVVLKDRSVVNVPLKLS